MTDPNASELANLRIVLESTQQKLLESEARWTQLQSSRLVRLLTRWELLRRYLYAAPGRVERGVGKVVSRVRSIPKRFRRTESVPTIPDPGPVRGGWKFRMEQFRHRHERLVFPSPASPTTVLLIPVGSTPEWTFAALQNACDHAGPDTRVILCGLPDAALKPILAACVHLTVLEKPLAEVLADLKEGEFVAVLAADMLVQPGAISSAVAALETGDAARIVGPVVMVNGLLAFPMGGDPWAGEAMHRRTVSATEPAFSLSRREGVDGKTVYDPGATVVSLSGRSGGEIPAAVGDGLRVLMIDDMPPHQNFGRGYPRSNAMLRILHEEGCRVTFFGMDTTLVESWRDIRRDIAPEIEVHAAIGHSGFEAFLERNRSRFDLLLVSRPHNMQQVRRVADLHPDWFASLPMIYDAEALFSLRQRQQRQLVGSPMPSAEFAEMLQNELRLTEGTRSILTVSRREQTHFHEAGRTHAEVLNHAVAVEPGPADLETRRGLLFVGSVRPNEPNEDAMVWFLSECFPGLRRRFPDLTLTIVGQMESPAVRNLAGDGVIVRGMVDDLSESYRQARVFIAPTRWSAGIPLKVVETAGYGVPVVCTRQLAEQLAWEDGKELLCGDTVADFSEAVVRLLRDATLWHRLRLTALERVRQEYSAERFRSTLKAAIGKAA